VQLLIVFLFTALVHAIETGAHAARLAGVRTGRLALAQSLYNVLALVAQGANTVAGPLIAVMADLAAKDHQTGALLANLRLVLLSATVGTLIAGLLIPSLSRILATGVASYEERRSLPRVIVRTVTVQGLWQIRRGLKKPALSAVRESRRSPFPRRLLLFSILCTSFFAVGNFAALYASALVPQGARTAASLAPVLTGSAVVLNILVVAPIVALVTDEALRGERPLEDVTYITIWLVGARLLGTLLSQALLQPMGWALASMTRWLVH
jgi:hypothetical protein